MNNRKLNKETKKRTKKRHDKKIKSRIFINVFYSLTERPTDQVCYILNTQCYGESYSSSKKSTRTTEESQMVYIA